MLRNSRGDGYGCLNASTLEVHTAPLQGGVFFVDMDLRSEDWDDVLSGLRSLPPSVAGSASQIVFRSPVLRSAAQDTPVISGSTWPTSVEETAKALQNSLQTSYRQLQVGVVELPLGEAPMRSEMLELDTLARCRAVELDYFLHAGQAVWRPQKYHYQLPSGHHAATFVRIADAFRNPRAPIAIATWLYGCVTETTAIVVDSGTLMPIVQQLDLTLRIAAVSRGEGSAPGLLAIKSIDTYPRSRFEYLQKFKAFDQLDVLALLSVSSTGRTYRMLRDTLEVTAQGRWRSECLVARGNEGATSLPEPEHRGQQAPWLSLGDELSPATTADRCHHCRDVNRARVVHVNPHSFAAMTLPMPTRIMPDTNNGRRNASLMNTYKRNHDPDAKRAGVQLVPVEATRPHRERRSTDPGRVRFEPTALLTSADDVSKLVENRIDELKALPSRDRSRSEIVAALEAVQGGNPTVAVCDPEEIRVLRKMTGPNLDPGNLMLLAAQEVCPSVRSVVMHSGSTGFGDKLDGHSSVLLIAAGLLTGVTLQQLVVSVQDHYRSREISPEMHGIVIHAIPADREAWRSVRNSFRDDNGATRLLALWLTYLPQESPFKAELDVLSEAHPDWFANARHGVEGLWENRLRWLSPDSSNSSDNCTPPESPLWSPQPVGLRRTSLYGDLDDRHTLVAVGAAMQEALQQKTSDGAPEWVQFDLPNAFRSYFDGLIHVAILRWVTPQRAWWGNNKNECEALIGELEGRFPEDWKLLLPELLLAAAQGKVPDNGVDFLLNQADSQLEAETWDADVLDYVGLGRVLAQRFRPPQDDP